MPRDRSPYLRFYDEVFCLPAEYCNPSFLLHWEVVSRSSLIASSDCLFACASNVIFCVHAPLFHLFFGPFFKLLLLLFSSWSGSVNFLADFWVGLNLIEHDPLLHDMTGLRVSSAVSSLGVPISGLRPIMVRHPYGVGELQVPCLCYRSLRAERDSLLSHLGDPRIQRLDRRGTAKGEPMTTVASGVHCLCQPFADVVGRSMGESEIVLPVLISSDSLSFLVILFLYFPTRVSSLFLLM